MTLSVTLLCFHRAARMYFLNICDIMKHAHC